MMKRLALLGAALALCAAPLAAAPRSPLNQVFQFTYADTCSDWADGSTSRGRLYLWVPEECRRVRGLVILATNVPEHMLVGHAAIREVCRANDLGLVWSVPTFWNFAKGTKGQEATQVAFLQKLLDGLARVSGYDEVARVPWVPVGESGHLLMVVGLVDQKPDRCIAAICVKNPHWPKNFTVPMLWTLGTAQEWGQSKSDIRTGWSTTAAGYGGWASGRAARDWPLSMIIEPATGHFYCTDEMADYFARYINAAVKARLDSAGGDTLRPVDLNAGFLANLPVPGQTDERVIPYAEAKPEERNRAWFFTADLARRAQELSRTNWQAATQLVGFTADGNCTATPFSFNSVTEINVQTDGEFGVKAHLLDAIPEGFAAAGEKLARTDGEPTVEWICGPFAPAGPNRFRIALDRTWKTGAASYLIAQQPGTADVRRSVQPAMVKLLENKEGPPQTITFEPIADVPASTRRVPLAAKSDAGLPVEFTVLSGPAVIEDGEVVLTPIPPRAKFPVEVTVGAWQWGRATEPKVQTAAMTNQTFRILAP